jgi:hypothetical protein
MIPRKPSAGKKNPPSSTEEHVYSVIFKGMASPAATIPAPEGEEKEQQVKLRLPVPLLKRIDAAQSSADQNLPASLAEGSHCREAGESIVKTSKRSLISILLMSFYVLTVCLSP